MSAPNLHFIDTFGLEVKSNTYWFAHRKCVHIKRCLNEMICKNLGLIVMLSFHLNIITLCESNELWKSVWQIHLKIKELHCTWRKSHRPRWQQISCSSVCLCVICFEYFFYFTQFDSSESESESEIEHFAHILMLVSQL